MNELLNHVINKFVLYNIRNIQYNFSVVIVYIDWVRKKQW